ncbi:opioid growth factor receptor-related protein [Bacteriovorax sp. Seq25_V]|uniref:opioid growth factor receptor-related protein n=1 Tax=Bacteriovorax sp. Seq25_V TaxID=1201288 RepID=UPI000389FB94|nr:opioid growth factor receptor-related protein [Bacteriovorax sp. Seq25_V]EQC45404.1 opioid growth factor receptor conserved region [Bacteriovorax sp. Seq25_V]
MSALLEFYTNRKSNPDGLFLKDIWNFSDWELENRHQYIQWLFPLEMKSNHNDTSLVVSADEVREALSSRDFQENLFHSLQLMEDFWGFKVKHKYHPESSPTMKKDYIAKNWVTLYNHNYIRITRVLHSLKIFGLEEEAKELLNYLETEVYAHNRHSIGQQTLDYWKSALETEPMFSESA